MSAVLLRFKANYLEKMRGLPLFFFVNSNSPRKDLLFLRGPNLAQKPLYLVGTVLKYLKPQGSWAPCLPDHRTSSITLFMYMRYVIITRRKPYLSIYDLSVPIYQTVRNIKLCKLELVSLCLGIFPAKWTQVTGHKSLFYRQTSLAWTVCFSHCRARDDTLESSCFQIVKQSHAYE